MASARRALCLGVTLGLLSLSGCDAGGLLVIEHKPEQEPGPAAGPPVAEMVGAGNVASNGQYQIYYVVGQPSPNQDVATSDDHQLQGGLVGAAHTD